ncbi:MAG: glycosyltransferase [Erysipelotrichaceae bacterium]
MITILTAGSRGDLQPYIALAQSLQRQQQEVQIVCGISLQPLVTSYGIASIAMSLDHTSKDIDPLLIDLASNASNPLQMLRAFSKMKAYAHRMVEEMATACEGSDLIIYHPGCTIGYFIAKSKQIPAVLACPFPMHATKEVASLISYGKTPMPKKLSYQLLQGMLWMASRDGIKAYKKHHPQAIEAVVTPYERLDKQHIAVVSCSNHVFSRPKDYSDLIYQSGYWFVKETSDDQPSATLSAFLEHHQAPVVIGFGSMLQAKDKQLMATLVIEALTKLGQRGILIGFGVLDSLPEHIFTLDEVPHTWLFPKCATIVHHGGAGTSAAAFRSGVSSVVVPFSNDQFAWAHRAYDLGVASKPLYRKHLSATRLAQAILAAQEPTRLANAKLLASKIQQEPGVDAIAQKIIALGEKQ